MEKSKRSLELDALRGVAALLVVLFHFTMGKKEALYGFNLGFTGVYLFFIISGFVILLTLEKTNSWKDFVINRFSRLYPTYWTCVTFTTIIILFRLKFHHSFSFSILPQYFANMTMFQSYLNYENIDGPYWTMLIEMIFYLYMLFIFISKKLHYIETISMFMLIPISFCYTHFFCASFPILFKQLIKFFPLISYFPLFCAGIVFYKIKFQKNLLIRNIYLIICYFCQLMATSAGNRDALFLSSYQISLMLLIYFVIFYLYITDKLLFIVNKVTVFLGTISFSLYLVHQYISLSVILPNLVKHLNIWLAFSVMLSIVIGLAFLINHFIEKPTMNYIRTLRKSKIQPIKSIAS